MSTDAHFEGWVGHDKTCIGNMKWETYTPKAWRETDVEIRIECCGVCGSDLHTARSGWGPTRYPCVVGHEIVGTVSRVGADVRGFKLGDRVGVGAQSDSCKRCSACEAHMEPWCENGIVGTYNGDYSVTDGSGHSMGGYAKYARVPAHFAVHIPDGLPSAVAAPMMCGGVTVYNPLKANGCGTDGVKNVGVVGIGGLGHFALLFAKALGATKITAISRTHSKEELARKLGATDFIASADKDPWSKHKRSLDLLILTNNNADMPLPDYMSLVRPLGKIVAVGIPEEPMMPTPLLPLAFSGVFLGGSAIGSPAVIREMLELAAKHNLQPMIEERDMKDANQVVNDMEDGKARFRYVLVNKDYEPVKA
ncbi:related to ADH6-NADPH-dependent alcohol dehydrogenase [Sporisorium reilianum SRZ2]|uniref:alcohol dehydrogenase (NADP(+)) n=1 Tax=Sporisorium reilianum (strain SRZ2) TaxID=999809 RepID=E7A1C5_SPORE|nr:related to ADH6-NADPH-dependent alcohol dehydrogenase [Sporisorium reilianum SRZ2]